MTMPKSVRVFISYAHEDETLRQKLEKQLSPLKRQNLIEVWHDREISAGIEWKLEEAILRIRRILHLAPELRDSVAVAPPRPGEFDDLLTRVKALQAQAMYVEALPLFERLTQIPAPSYEQSFDMWLGLGNVL